MRDSVQAMSDVELLGTMVGGKTAARMLNDAGGSLWTVLNESVASYCTEDKSKTKLRAAKEFVRRALLETLRQRNTLSSPASVREYLRITFAGLEHEVFLVLFLDAQNRIIATEEMFRGTLTQTSVYPREVVKRSLYNNAGAVILAHFVPRNKMTFLYPSSFCCLAGRVH